MGSVKREDLVRFPSPLFFFVGGAQPPLFVSGGARAGGVKGGEATAEGGRRPLMPPSTLPSARAFTMSSIPRLAGSEVRRAEISAMRPPSIRAGAMARSPGAACAQQLSGARLEEAPHLSHRAAAWTAPAGVRAPLPTGIFEIVEVTSPACVDSRQETVGIGVSRDPGGTTPWSTNRQSATSSLRAKATIPIRRCRLLPPPNRCANQRLSSLSGW